jgi:hypothetical protein
VLLLAYSGMRRAELTRMHVGGFDFLRNVFLVRGKTDDAPAPITAPIRDAALRLVERALARQAANGEAAGFLLAGANNREGRA